VIFFVITTNKNKRNSIFIAHLRRNDLLVIFYTRRHEFLYRLSCRHSPRSLSIISQQSWYAIKVFSNEWYPESITTENVKCVTLPRFTENVSEKWTNSHTNAQSGSSRRTDFPNEFLPWVTKPTIAQKCTNYLVLQIHYPPTRFGHSCGHTQASSLKGWIYRDIIKVCEPMRRCKMLSSNNTWFKIRIEI